MSRIGVFDSGVGGLTVLKSLAENFPQHDFIYLADTARLPYGTKSSSTIASYLKRNVEFLKSFQVEGVIVACNTASTVLIQSDLNFDLPVFNVIEPGAEAALQASQNKKIGVLGTRATVLSQAYVKALKNIDPTVEVHQMAAPLLVPLVEEGWVEDPLTSMVVYRYTQPLLDAGVDTLILGCTHYPVLKSSFQRVAASKAQLVDSPLALRKNVHGRFPELSKTSEGEKGMIRIYCTDLTPHLEQLINYLISPLSSQPIQKVDI
jgi:glutamate racemase